MSKAFVKDEGESVDELPDRPISPHPNIVTTEGLTDIEATLACLLREHARVQALNDRAALATLSRELRYWASRRTSAQVVATPLNPKKVEFGCSVTISRDDGRQQTYRIVGEDEADPSRGTISYVSPAARALIDKQVGETVQSDNQTLNSLQSSNRAYFRERVSDKLLQFREASARLNCTRGVRPFCVGRPGSITCHSANRRNDRLSWCAAAD